ncbi:MAG: glycosyltransferase family 2 protein [Actinomycetota bacterium]
MSVAAIVPAHNEAARIGATVRALRAIDEIDAILVVDDASTDGTGRIATDVGANVVRLERRTGKGGALRAGLPRTDADVLVFIDGDLGETASIARALLGPVIAGEEDMTIAAPPPDGPSGFGLVESTARAGIKALTGRTFGRPLSGQRALRRSLVERTGIAGHFGVEVALTIDALRAGFRVREIPQTFTHARTGRDPAGFAHRARQGLDIVSVLATRVRRSGGRT